MTVAPLISKVSAICIYNDKVDTVVKTTFEDQLRFKSLKEFPKVKALTNNFEECLNVVTEILVQDFLSQPMESWSQQQVESWMENKTRTKKPDIEILVEAKVDGKALSEITSKQLKEKGFKIADAIILTK